MKRLLVLVVFAFMFFSCSYGMTREERLCASIDTLFLNMEHNNNAYLHLLCPLYDKADLEYPPSKLAFINEFKERCVRRIDEVEKMILFSDTVSPAIHKKLLEIIIMVLRGR